MLLYRLDRRLAAAIRLAGLGLVSWSLFASRNAPGLSGRELVVSLLLGAAALSWLFWVPRPDAPGVLTPDLYAMAAAGGALIGASPNSAASVFVFAAAFAAGLRTELMRALTVVAVGVLGFAITVIVYQGSALGLLAYALAFAASALAASNARQRVLRAEQAELLLAQTQRSQEEQLRAARLEESTRIAREIHDVLAHSLAGLTIQLEATRTLIEQGADPGEVLERVNRAHELARQGLRETRAAVGALRGEPLAAPAAIEALVAEYRSTSDGHAEATIDGDAERVTGATGQAVLRVAQEALTNVRKHAPGADVSIALHAGDGPDGEVVLVIDDRRSGGSPPTKDLGALAQSGGGYGLIGMRERAQALGGTLRAGRTGDGWQVELRLPGEPSARVAARAGS